MIFIRKILLNRCEVQKRNNGLSSIVTLILAILLNLHIALKPFISKTFKLFLAQAFIIHVSHPYITEGKHIHSNILIFSSLEIFPFSKLLLGSPTLSLYHSIFYFFFRRTLASINNPRYLNSFTFSSLLPPTSTLPIPPPHLLIPASNPHNFALRWNDFQSCLYIFPQSLSPVFSTFQQILPLAPHHLQKVKCSHPIPPPYFSI